MERPKMPIVRLLLEVQRLQDGDTMKTKTVLVLGGVSLCVACLGMASALSAQEPKLKKTLTGQKGPINGIAYSPDGKTLA
jgi:hypothetical protein